MFYEEGKAFNSFVKARGYNTIGFSKKKRIRKKKSLQGII